MLALSSVEGQRKTPTMSSTGLTALMLKGNTTLQIWDDDDNIGVDDDDNYGGFSVRVPGSPLTAENFASEDNPNCGHDAIAKALRALGVMSHDGLKIGGATAPTMGDFVKLFHVDIDAFKKSDSEVASLFGADTEKENKNPIIQGVYEVLKKGKAFSYFRQFAIDLACTEPEGLQLSVAVLPQRPARYLSDLNSSSPTHDSMREQSTSKDSLDILNIRRKMRSLKLSAKVDHVDRRRFRGRSRFSRISSMFNPIRIILFIIDSKRSSSSLSSSMRINDTNSNTSIKRKIKSSCSCIS